MRPSFHEKLAFLFAVLCLGLSLTACDSPEEKEAKYIERGNVLFEQGSYDKAKLEYKNAARINPTSAEVRYRLGLTNEAQGDLRNAFTSYLSAEQQDMAFVPALLKLAQYYLVADQQEQSKKRIDAVLSVQPNNAQAHALLAGMFFHQKNFEETEKEARLALEKDPTNVMAFSVLTNLYLQKNEKDKAASTIEEALAQNPENLPLLLQKAMTYEARDEMGQVAEAYEVIFRLKPDIARFRSDLAELYMKRNQAEQAEKILRDGVAERPNNKDMQRTLFNFLDKTKSAEEAENEIRQAIKANPANSDYIFWLAELYIKHQDAEKAIALLEEMVARAQSETASLVNAQISLARLYFTKGNREIAENLVKIILKKESNNPSALLIRARLSFEQGDYQSAISDLRTILRDNPRAVNALQLLAETLLMQGHLDLAIDTLTQLVAADPSSMPAQIRLAQLYNLRGESAHALKILEFVNEVHPELAVGWESAARVAIDAKEWEKAERAIQKLEATEDQKNTALFLKGRMASAKLAPEEAMPLYERVILADPSAPLSEHALTELTSLAHSPELLKKVAIFMESLPSRTAFADTLLSEIHLKRGEDLKAGLLLDQVLLERPSFAAPYLLRVNLYLKENRHEEALALLEEARKAVPNDLRAAMMQADILGQTKEYQAAIDGYAAILKKNPKVDLAANNMAQLIADHQKDNPEALEKARIAAERFISSSNPLLLDTLAWVHFQQGNLTQAQTILERIMTFGDKLPGQIHYHYGAILLKMNRPDQARLALKKALANPAPYPGREEAEKLARTIQAP